MTPELQKSLQQLADKLGVAADQLWGCLLKQAPISAGFELVVCVLLATAGATLLKYVVHRHVALEKYEDWTPAMIISGIVCAICLLVAILVFTIDGANIFAGFFNPQYWALKELLSK